jgi:acyl carrier protein
MLDKTSITSILLDLARTAAPRLGEATGDLHTANLREAGMTSVAAVRFMLEIEAAFDIAIPDSELTPENFSNVDSVERLVLRIKASTAH